MKIDGIQYPYALRDDGSVRKIDDVTLEERKHHVFSCFECNHRMKAVLKDDYKQRHFSHCDEDCGKESYLHGLGKWLFKSLFERLLESCSKRSIRVEYCQTMKCNVDTCPYGEMNFCEKKEVESAFVLYPRFTKCLVEEFDSETGLKPDILLANDLNEKMYVEIFFSHEVTEKKIAQAKQIPILEITIKDFSDLELIRDALGECGTGVFHCRERNVQLYNVYEKIAYFNPYCENPLTYAMQSFMRFYEECLLNKRDLFLNYFCRKICDKDCSNLKDKRCNQKRGVARYSLTEHFDKIEDRGEKFNLYLIDCGRNNLIRVDFVKRLHEEKLPEGILRIIQIAIDIEKDELPWEGRTEDRLFEIVENNCVRYINPNERFYSREMLQAMRLFKIYYEECVASGKSFSIKFHCNEFCQCDCPYLKSQRCASETRMTSKDITLIYKKVVYKNEQYRLYLVADNGDEILVNFVSGTKNFVSLNKDCFVIQFKIDGLLTLPWNTGSDLVEGVSVKFHHIDKLPFTVGCCRQYCKLFVLYKNGDFSLWTQTDITEIFEKYTKEKGVIKDYILYIRSLQEDVIRQYKDWEIISVSSRILRNEKLSDDDYLTEQLKICHDQNRFIMD